MCSCYSKQWYIRKYCSGPENFKTSFNGECIYTYNDIDIRIGIRVQTIFNTNKLTVYRNPMYIMRVYATLITQLIFF